MKYRYPGVRSFTRDDGDLFFGRKNDEERLYKLVRLEKLVTLYGKSGYGKSSLLQAKILPRLEKETDYIPISVRFYGHRPGIDKAPDPLERTRLAIRKWADEFAAKPLNAGAWLDQLIPQENSLWYHTKKAQAATGKQRFVLVFDQFEELFTYPETNILQFRAQLADLLFVQIPQNFRDAYTSGVRLERADSERYFEDVEVRVLFSIRADYLHLMNRLKDFLPQVLRHCYELDALSLDQAREAITGPAQLTDATPSQPDEDLTPAFEYDPEAVNVVLNFLSKNGKDKIESFNLQLVCSHIENKFVRDQAARRITADMFGATPETRNKYLQAVNQNYYEACIEKMPADQRDIARKIVETELVTVEDKRRIIADAGMLVSRYRNEGASAELLEELKDTYLLRGETTPRGTAYELSHDALVEPILDARAQRERIEEKQKADKRRRRNVAVVAGALLVAAISVGGMILAFIQWNYANKERDKAKQALAARDQAQKEKNVREVQALVSLSGSFSQRAGQSLDGGCTELRSAVFYLREAAQIDTATIYPEISAQKKMLETQIGASACPDKTALLQRLKK